MMEHSVKGVGAGSPRGKHGGVSERMGDVVSERIDGGEE